LRAGDSVCSHMKFVRAHDRNGTASRPGAKTRCGARLHLTSARTVSKLSPKSHALPFAAAACPDQSLEGVVQSLQLQKLGVCPRTAIHRKPQISTRLGFTPLVCICTCR
jgi:hypothetical protein